MAFITGMMSVGLIVGPTIGGYMDPPMAGEQPGKEVVERKEGSGSSFSLNNSLGFVTGMYAGA